MLAKNQVTILTSSGAINKKKGVKLVCSKILVQIGKIVLMPFFIIDSFWAVIKSDVVNCHLPQIEAIIVIVWAKIFKKRIVTTYHCETNMNFIFKPFVFILGYVCCFLSDTIVTNTMDFAENSYVLKYFLKKVIPILPPIDIDPRKYDKDFYKTLAKSESNSKLISFVGRISREKGLEYLLSAFEKILKEKPDYRLILAGPTTTVGENKYKKLIEVAALKNHNIFQYYDLSKEKIISLYKASDCLVLPSIDSLETFGLVQAEAMLCGTPVVASNLPGVRVPVRLTGMGTLAEVGNSADLANKIQLVLNKKYKNRAKRIFSLKNFYSQYYKAFLA